MSDFVDDGHATAAALPSHEAENAQLATAELQPTDSESTTLELGPRGKAIYVVATVVPALSALYVGAATNLEPEKTLPIAFSTWIALQGILGFKTVATEKHHDFATAWEKVTGFAQALVGLSTALYAIGLLGRQERWLALGAAFIGFVGLFVAAKVVQIRQRRVHALAPPLIEGGSQFSAKRLSAEPPGSPALKKKVQRGRMRR